MNIQQNFPLFQQTKKYDQFNQLLDKTRVKHIKDPLIGVENLGVLDILVKHHFI